MLRQRRSEGDGDDVDDVGEEVEKVTHVKAQTAITTLRNYFQQHSADLEIFAKLHKLQKTVAHTLCASRSQTKSTDFFKRNA